MKISLSEVERQIGYVSDSTWAWDNYKNSVISIIRAFGYSNVLEIGGGRAPLFSADEISSMGLRYTVNDIAQSELDRAPSYVEKRCFDIAGFVPITDSYDFAFSKMVFEHVRDGKRAYGNLARVIRPGGLVLNFHPTLFSPPFIANRLMPEGLSRVVLRAMFAERNDEQIPKFPAYYSWCRVSKSVEMMICEAGFRQAKVFPFYGHAYYQNIPIARHLAAQLTNFCKRNEVRILSSYGYTIAIG